MRSREFITPPGVLEGLMSPNSMRRAAIKTQARAGMEFEMYVPNVVGFGDEDEDTDPEKDYDEDVTARSFEQIIDFFADNDHNDSRQIARLRRNMESDYEDWVMIEVEEFFARNAGKIVEQYLIDVEDLQGDELATVLDTALENTGNDQYYKKALKSFINDPDDYNFYTNQDAWVQTAFNSMRDVEQAYDINWPHWYTPDVEKPGFDVDDIAHDFKKAMGRPVNISDRYHGAKRDDNTYVIEPDGSLDRPNDQTDSGMEFVSPTLPITDMLSDLNKVVTWAKKRGCYTNSSCGLHMNVSLPSFDFGGMDRLDYVKLVLFSGDAYVLEQFQRQFGGGNDASVFAASSLGKIKQAIESKPAAVEQMLALMREQMNAVASKIIYDQGSSRYVSINRQTDYIEFRSPGGDWLNQNMSKLENTLLRFVVALEIASDETQHREEYAKKLYKLLTGGILVAHYDPSDPANSKQPSKFLDRPQSGAKQIITSVDMYKDLVNIFVMYNSGGMPTEELKKFVKKHQTTRERDRKGKQLSLPGFDNKPPASASAAGAADAWAALPNPPPVGNLLRWVLLMGGQKVFELDAATQGDANQQALQWLRQQSPEFFRSHEDQSADVVPMSSLSGSQTADGGSRWFTVANPAGFQREIQANSTSEAFRMARERYPDDFTGAAEIIRVTNTHS